MHEPNDREKHIQSADPNQDDIPTLKREMQRPVPTAPEKPPQEDPKSITVVRTPNFFVHALPSQPEGERARKPGDTFWERIRWNAVERQHLMAAQTRMLPAVTTVSTHRREIATPIVLEVFIVALLLGIALALQAFNLFNFPAYTIEEGRYMANAWAILHGKLEPYIYTYDHPPLGWLQIAVWFHLTGGIASFGDAMNSGRVLMLVLTLASSLLLYPITYRLSGSRNLALLAIVIYTLSPLSMLYRREVLLDTIGTFWLLLSLYLITTEQSKLLSFVFAAIALGVAIVTKETLILFLPVYLYGVWLYATQFQRKFLVISFLYITLAIASGYVLLAALKGEFFPPGVFPGDKGPHPSLIGALIGQWQTPLVGGQFRESWNVWLQADRLLLIGGSVAMFINILMGIGNRFQLFAGLLSVSFWLFLLASNVVYGYSIVPLLPFLAINLVLAYNTVLQWFIIMRRRSFYLIHALLCFVLVVAFTITGAQQIIPLLKTNASDPQRQAMLWLRNNVPHQAMVITNTYMYTDLHEPGGLGVGNAAPFTHAHLYTNAALDPDVYIKELKGDWQKIDYLVLDNLMLQEISIGDQYVLLNRALHHAKLRVTFGSNKDGTQIQIYQVTHT